MEENVRLILRSIASFEARIGALEWRFSAMEDRAIGFERTLDKIARSGHRVEQMLADLLARGPEA